MLQVCPLKVMEATKELLLVYHAISGLLGLPLFERAATHLHMH